MSTRRADTDALPPLVLARSNATRFRSSHKSAGIWTPVVLNGRFSGAGATVFFAMRNQSTSCQLSIGDRADGLLDVEQVYGEGVGCEVNICDSLSGFNSRTVDSMPPSGFSRVPSVVVVLAGVRPAPPPPTASLSLGSSGARNRVARPSPLTVLTCLLAKC